MSGGRNLPIAYMWCILIIFSMTCDNSLAFLPTISTVGNSKYDTTPSPYILARQSMFSKSSPLLNMAKLPTPEESAKQLTEYMAKAHEEKLKAVAAAESKSQARIQVRGSGHIYILTTDSFVLLFISSWNQHKIYTMHTSNKLYVHWTLKQILKNIEVVDHLMTFLIYL